MSVPVPCTFEVNGRTYRPGARVYAAICVDGCGDEYLSESLIRGRMPNLAGAIRKGKRFMGRGVIPSFTNPNNSSIITGAPPAVHGINGNYFLDPESGGAVMMNDGKFLKAPTIVATAARAGRRCAIVTAKEKLRTILAHDLDGIGFSAEKAGQAERGTHGIDGVEALVGEKTPPIYSPDASVYVLKAGAAMVEQGLADLLYLSLTDYMQHKFAPEEPESLDFHARLDEQIGRLLAAGVVLGITADHGMNAKHSADGRPRVVYLDPILLRLVGPGCRVILPITDPYVAHHGSLGSFAVVHVPPGTDLARVRRGLMGVPEVTEVMEKDIACEKLQLHPERLGDLVVMCGRDTTLGTSPAEHDLSQLDRPLRSHGGRYEEMVPMIVSEPLNAAYRAKAEGDPRNFDIFDFTINGTGS
ncbi:MAG: phosphonoacetate hydrolase [Phycisphaerales bacterium]|nr:phosphonoacetate hydrolase [Phycisphaerales bacterium]